MLVPEGGRTVVKLLDISLARALFDDGIPEGANHLRLTREGVLIGSPEYMAPEQACDPHTADIRADIYSLGCVLYHALAGQPPFHADTTLGLVIRHASDPPRPLTEFNPEVPDGLWKVIDWMMAKNPAQRYLSPERAAQALEAFLTAEGPTEPLSEEEPPPAAESLDEPAAPEPIPSPAPVAVEASSLPPESDLGESPALTADMLDVVPITVPIPEPRERTSFHPTRRECLALVIGATGLLLAEAVGWLLAQWISR
jgi:serine/threonine protein kinase